MVPALQRSLLALAEASVLNGSRETSDIARAKTGLLFSADFYEVIEL